MSLTSEQGLALERAGLAATGTKVEPPKVDRAPMLADLVAALTEAIRVGAAQAVRDAPRPPAIAPAKPRAWRFEVRRDGGLITEIIAHPMEPDA